MKTTTIHWAIELAARVFGKFIHPPTHHRRTFLSLGRWRKADAEHQVRLNVTPQRSELERRITLDSARTSQWLAWEWY